jgi:hypothetical protein
MYPYFKVTLNQKILNMKSTAKKILFLTEVHGNEKIGTLAVNELQKRFKNISTLLANQRASEQKTRFVDCDLNRCAPGSLKSKKYEKRRAAEILKISEDFDFVVDIHGSVSNTDIFIIVTNPKIENLALACALPIKNIVIWPGKKNLKTGPLTEFMNCAVEIECGPQDSPRIKLKLEKIIVKIITEGLSSNKPNFKNKNVFEVKDKIIRKNSPDLRDLKDFEPVVYNGKEIIPLFVNQYPKVLCFTLKRLGNPDSLLASVAL